MTTTVADVRKAAQLYFRLTKEQITAADSSYRVAHPRQIAMTIARDMTRASLPNIAKQFGGLNHATVLAGIKQTFRRTRKSEDVALDYTMVFRLSRDVARQRQERELAWAARLLRGEISWPALEAAE